MENLFLYLWIADIVEAVNGISLVLLIVFSLTSLLVFLPYFFSEVEGRGVASVLSELKETVCAHKKVFKVLLTIPVCCLVLLLAFPSRTTVLLSVGASVTTEAIESPIAQKALQVLDKKLDELLAEEDKRR